MQSGTDFYTYPLDIDPMQDHLKISIYKRNEDFEETGKRVVFKVQDPLVLRQQRLKHLVKNSNFIPGGGIFNNQTRESGDGGDSMLGSQLQGSVMLPMPKVVDTNGCEWGESEVNIFGLAGTIEAGGKLVRRAEL